MTYNFEFSFEWIRSPRSAAPLSRRSRSDPRAASAVPGIHQSADKARVSEGCLQHLVDTCKTARLWGGREAKALGQSVLTPQCSGPIHRL
ncbi:hypothetical protein EYF80_045921 [Liparis tanakae]|uniref:Uncharacterized protein n=1 Tax=Liparis tanakae TaxID=230148 RepID=A0A4Z2FRW7_9TELE|nr:hypothetical protein EYF80_045921 [Liparis tanakae]